MGRPDAAGAGTAALHSSQLTPQGPLSPTEARLGVGAYRAPPLESTLQWLRLTRRGTPQLGPQLPCFQALTAGEFGAQEQETETLENS